MKCNILDLGGICEKPPYGYFPKTTSAHVSGEYFTLCRYHYDEISNPSIHGEFILVESKPRNIIMQFRSGLEKPEYCNKTAVGRVPNIKCNFGPRKGKELLVCEEHIENSLAVKNNFIRFKDEMKKSRFELIEMD